MFFFCTHSTFFQKVSAHFFLLKNNIFLYKKIAITYFLSDLEIVALDLYPLKIFFVKLKKANRVYTVLCEHHCLNNSLSI